jgi:hypothetical protein
MSDSEFQPSNRDKKKDKEKLKPPMKINSAGLKKIILPLLGKRSKEEKK